METDKPSYYAIIPADVRYDKTLSANAKLLYGELTCLSNKHGYCFSSNNYFAELYEVTPQAISKWISSLEKKGYIRCEYLYNGKEIKERRIFMNEKLVKTEAEGVSTMVDTYKPSVDRGINKGLKGYKRTIKDNITSNSNTRDNNTSNTGYTEVVKVYFENFKMLYQNGKVKTEKPFFSSRSGSAIKGVLDKLSKDEVILVLNNALNDNWIINQGYTLTTILSESQINKLLNAKQNCNGYNNFNKTSLDEKIDLTGGQ